MHYPTAHLRLKRQYLRPRRSAEDTDSPVELAFIGLNGIHSNNNCDLDFGNGFSLEKPNDFLLSARSKYFMSKRGI